MSQSQQIYFPLGSTYPIPYEFEADTMQVPRGQYSVLSELAKGNLTNAEAMIYLCLNHGSTWNSGSTWCMSGHYLSNLLGTGMSRIYVQRILAKLTDKGWIETIDKDNPSGYQYQIRHHLCDWEDVPVNRDGKPLKFAVPRGPGGPIERCMERDISWKAALVWIVLKHRSNWKAREDTAGQTEKATLLELSKRCRMKNAGFQKIIAELTQAGMLERLSPKSQPAIFQLYPKPAPKSDQPSKPKREPIRLEWAGGRELKTDGEYWYSDNHQYRCSREYPHDIEGKRRGGTWKRVSEYHKNQVMYSSILRDFEAAIEAKREAEKVLSS